MISSPVAFPVQPPGELEMQTVGPTLGCAVIVQVDEVAFQTVWATPGPVKYIGQTVAPLEGLSSAVLAGSAGAGIACEDTMETDRSRIIYRTERRSLTDNRSKLIRGR